MGLDTVELVLEVEQHFGVSVPDEMAERIETVGELAQLVCHLRREAGLPLRYPDALSGLQDLTSRLFRIPLDRIGPDARFVKDLGLDQ